ncbi:hypothetical protein LTS18_010953, partial [Coniosporium uncinatum]
EKWLHDKHAPPNTNKAKLAPKPKPATKPKPAPRKSTNTPASNEDPEEDCFRAGSFQEYCKRKAREERDGRPGAPRKTQSSHRSKRRPVYHWSDSDDFDMKPLSVVIHKEMWRGWIIGIGFDQRSPGDPREYIPVTARP